MTRRTLLRTLPLAASKVIVAGRLQDVRIHLRPDENLGDTPEDFLGFGYEISSVATKGLLTARNTSLLPFIKTLGPKGTIRVGGNTSDFSIWSPEGVPKPLPKGTITSKESIRDLGTCLDATGWDLIWGLNLGRGTPESAADQAAAVSEAAREHLLCFEIGNEPDLFVQQGHRMAGYNYSEYHADFQRFTAALERRVSGIRLAGPDVAGQPGWVTQFAADEGKRLRLLTEHYYAAGPPENPNATIENLLRTDESFIRMTRQLQAASMSSGVPYRLVEVNSCFGGGKPGMSDTFASALWGLDLMFTLADAGGAGINWETGVNHLGWISVYSPIWDDQHGNYSARPLYYALLAFSRYGIGRRYPVLKDGDNINLKAWGVIGKDRKVRLTIINKDLQTQASVRVTSSQGISAGELEFMTAPSCNSKTGVSLAGSQVTTQGSWQPGNKQTLRARKGELEIRVPAASAVAVELS